MFSVRDRPTLEMWLTLLTLSLAHVSTAVEAAERVVDAVNIRLADTPAVRGPSSTLRRGPVNCPLLLN